MSRWSQSQWLVFGLAVVYGGGTALVVALHALMGMQG